MGGSITRELAPFIVTSSGSLTTNAVERCDDATCIEVFISTGVSGTLFVVQVSPYDPTVPLGQGLNVTVTSSLFYALQYLPTTAATNLVSILPGQSYIIPQVGFQRMRLLGTGAETSGVTVGWATKQIRV